MLYIINSLVTEGESTSFSLVGVCSDKKKAAFTSLYPLSAPGRGALILSATCINAPYNKNIGSISSILGLEVYTADISLSVLLFQSCFQDLHSVSAFFVQCAQIRHHADQGDLRAGEGNLLPVFGTATVSPSIFSSVPSKSFRPSWGLYRCTDTVVPRARSTSLSVLTGRSMPGEQTSRKSYS